MSNGLANLERKAFRSFWDDGLLDTMLGMGIMLVGFSWWEDMAVLGAVFPAIGVSMWRPLRSKLIEPRLGYVEFSGKRELKARSFRHGMTSFMLGTMMLGAVVFLAWNSGKMPAPREMVAGFPASLIALMAIPFALFTGCRRFYGYAVVMLVAGVATVLLGLHPGPPMLAGGVVTGFCGFTLLTRFMRSHPKESGMAS